MSDAVQYERLVAIGMRLSGELKLSNLVEQLCREWPERPALAQIGIFVLDPERELVHAYLAARGAPPSVAVAHYAVNEEPFDGRHGDGGQLDGPSGDHAPTGQRDDLTGDGPRLPAPAARLLAAGANGYLTSPLHIGGRRFALLAFVASAPGTPNATERAFVRDVARLIAPIAWNCLIQERFDRGDRRRDALVELSNSINTTLQVDAVIAAARQVLGRLADDGVASINLIDPEGRSYRAYEAARRVSDTPDAVRAVAAAALPPPPLQRSLENSVIAWVRQHRELYQSPDLQRHPRFIEDADLLAAGVRRYAALPLRARGQSLGALLIGWTNPHPALKIDSGSTTTLRYSLRWRSTMPFSMSSSRASASRCASRMSIFARKSRVSMTSPR